MYITTGVRAGGHKLKYQSKPMTISRQEDVHKEKSKATCANGNKQSVTIFIIVKLITPPIILFSKASQVSPSSLSRKYISLSLMGSNHRKLFDDTANETLNQICKHYCDPKTNIDGACPVGCISLCYPTCNRSLISQQSAPPLNFPSPSDDEITKKSHKFPLSFKISLAILIFAFFLFCCYAIYKCYTVWCRSRNRATQPRNQENQETREEFLNEDYGPVMDHPIWYIRTVGLQPSVISAITICKYKKGEGLVEGTECSVCLSEFQEDETLRLLPKCSHAFHIPCIDTWLTSHTNCPLCRAGIVKAAAGSPSPELSFGDPAPAEETQLGVSDSNREYGSEREIEGPELGIRVEEEEEISEIPKAEVGDSSNNLELIEIQPMRRSVSLDSSSAAMISAAMANVRVHHPVQSQGNLDTQLAKVNKPNTGLGSKRSEFDFNQSLLRLVGSSTIGRSLQKGPVSMKRSFSSGGKFVLSRQNRTRDSVLPS